MKCEMCGIKHDDLKLASTGHGDTCMMCKDCMANDPSFKEVKTGSEIERF